MTAYTNDGDGTTQLQAMLRIVVRQTIWKTAAQWLERCMRRLPDSWLNARLEEIESEALTELLEVLRTLRMIP